MSETNQELIQRFLAGFQAATSETLGELEALRNGTSTQLAVDKLAVDVAKLRKDLTDAIAFLPGYDQRQCENKLKDIEAQLESLRASTAPKSKFAFKRKAKPASTPLIQKSSTKEAGTSDKLLASSSEPAPPTSGLSLSGHTQAYLTVSSLSAPWSAASDLTISDLDRCVVNLVPSEANADVPSDLTFTALHVRNITNSVVLLPIISGSALLHDMKNCVIVLGSRQFRMHTSSQVDVYISITSNPIIEHCSAVRFADYPTRLRPALSADSPQDVKSNYLAVQDFSHIRSTPSPNWSALPEDEKIADEQWPLARADVRDAIRTLLPSR